MSRHANAETPTYPARNRLLGQIHAMAKELRLSDESYRDVIERVAGQRSAALVQDDKLYAVVQEFQRLGAGRKGPTTRRSKRPVADSAMAMRCRALWLNLWHLDELESGTEESLAAFVKRQTGREDLRFCNAEQIAAVIEGLKDMCSRVGLDMKQVGNPLVPKRNLVREQWARLHKAGWAKVAGDSGLAGFAHGSWCTPNARSIDQMEGPHLDRLADKLGRIVRSHRLGRRHDAAEGASD
ncbi:MAG: regulatory protein GemA [Reyranella sp.]